MGTQRTSILFLSADPTDASRLRLGQELRDIETRLRLASARDAFELHHRASVRVGDLTQAIFDTKPAIIHFSGHGSAAGELFLENDAGQVHPVTPEALEALFALCKREVRCVILNACYSQRQAIAISKHIDHVIGMTQDIGDDAAIAFSAGFYKALGAGRPVPDCFEFGRTELRLYNIPEYRIPLLIQRPTVKHMFLEARDYLVQRGRYSERVFSPEYDLFVKLFAEDEIRQGCILIDPDAYENIGDILDDVYTNYLHEHVPILSYGELWLISKCAGCLYPIVSWQWLLDSDNTRHDELWTWSRRTRPSAVDLNRGDKCIILFKRTNDLAFKKRLIMIACNSKLIYNIAHSWNIKRIWILLSRLTEIPTIEFDSDKYVYKILIDLMDIEEPMKHRIFVDSQLSESELASLERFG